MAFGLICCWGGSSFVVNWLGWFLGLAAFRDLGWSAGWLVAWVCSYLLLVPPVLLSIFPTLRLWTKGPFWVPPLGAPPLSDDPTGGKPSWGRRSGWSDGSICWGSWAVWKSRRTETLLKERMMVFWCSKHGMSFWQVVCKRWEMGRMKWMKRRKREEFNLKEKLHPMDGGCRCAFLFFGLPCQDRSELWVSKELVLSFKSCKAKRPNQCGKNVPKLTNNHRFYLFLHISFTCTWSLPASLLSVWPIESNKTPCVCLSNTPSRGAIELGPTMLTSQAKLVAWSLQLRRSWHRFHWRLKRLVSAEQRAISKDPSWHF